MDKESIRFRNIFSVLFYAHGGKGNVEHIWQIGKKREQVTRTWGATKEEAIANYNRILGREFPKNDN